MKSSYIYKLKKDIAPFKTAIVTVIISVSAAFIVSVISSAGKQLINNEMTNIGLNGLSAMAYSANGENMTNYAFYNDIAAMSDTQTTTPLMYDTSVITFPNGITMEAMCWGIDNSAAEIISLEITEGRMFNSSDIENDALICLVDENVAKSVYNRTNICGKTINIQIGNKTANLTIAGTIKKGSNVLNTLTGDIIPNFIYVPYTTMKSLSSKANFDQIVFTSTNTQQTAKEFKENLTDINNRYKKQTIKLTNLSGQKEQISKIADIAFISLFVVSCVAVVVCSMSVGASVNTAVISRQKDIGIKISMGASRANITLEFLYLAVLACAIGIAISFLGIFVMYFIIYKYVNFSFKIDYFLIVLSISVTIVLTTVFSLLPSYNAAKMPPIKALNRE